MGREVLMKRWSWLLVAVLAVSPAFAAEKKKDDKKGKETPPAKVDVVQEAEAKAAAGDVKGAIEDLEKAIAVEPRAALRVGVLREKAGELDLAIDAYKVAGEKMSGPGQGEALGRMAVLQVTRGMPEAAASAAAAVAADPEGVWPTIAMAYRRAQEGQGAEAVALAEKAVAAGGGASAKTALGRALMAKGDMAAAEAAYREALAAEPNSLMTLVGLATVLRKTGRAAEAEPMLKTAADAGAVEAHKERARVLIALGRAEEALGEANLAAAMSPENDTDAQRLVVEVKVARSLVDVSQGQIDLAVEDLSRLVGQNPESAAAQLGLAKAQIARRDAAAALAALQKAVALDPKDAEAQYQLGFVQHMMKRDVAGALPAFEQAVALEPGNPTYRTGLGGALVEAGQLDRAIQELSKVTSAAGYTGSDAWFYLGTAHFNAKRYKESAEALEKSVAIKADNAQAEGLLAWCYVALKDTENFKKHGAAARKLGFKDADLMARLQKIEAGETFKEDKPKTTRPRPKRVP
jgi:cellulose synthase operon protein C